MRVTQILKFYVWFYWYENILKLVFKKPIIQTFYLKTNNLQSFKAQPNHWSEHHSATASSQSLVFNWKKLYYYHFQLSLYGK